MQRVFRFLLILAFAAASHAGLAGDRGTYDFLRLDVGARAGALNGSFVSMTNDPNLLFYNPAALPTLERTSFSLGYFKHLLDVNAGSLTFGTDMEGFGPIGVGIMYIDYGSFDETDASENTLGTFGAREIALSAGWGTEIGENTNFGAAIKLIHSVLASYTSTGVAADFGVLYFIPSEQITLGASVLNLGAQTQTYAGVRESLPLDVRIGITKRPEHLPVLLNLNFHNLNEQRDNLLQHFQDFSFGAEFLLSESLRLRLGYDNEHRRELKLGTSAGLAGFSAGLGLLIDEYSFDYAFNSMGKIGGFHRLSVGMTL